MSTDRSARLLDRLPWPVESHLNLTRYHFFLLMLTCPPVVCAAPEKRPRPDCNILTISVVGVVGDGDIWVIIESLTKQFCTNL